jgi:hypothetical protein
MNSDSATDKYYRVYLTKPARVKLRGNILFRSFLINDQYFKCSSIAAGDVSEFAKMTFPYRTADGMFSIELQIPSEDIMYVFSFPEEQKSNIFGFVKEEQQSYSSGR